MYKCHIQGRLMGEKLGLWFPPYKGESLWRLMGGNLVLWFEQYKIQIRRRLKGGRFSGASSGTSFAGRGFLKRYLQR